MSIIDMAKVGLGVSTHEKKLKKLGLTPCDIMIAAYHHEQPPVVPNTFVDGAMITPMPSLQKYDEKGIGKDAWGVEWVFDAEQFSFVPTVGNPVLDDVTKWKEVVRFPDLNSFDWERISDDDIHCDGLHKLTTMEYRRLPKNGRFNDGNKCGIAMSLIGPTERFHALMGFQNALEASVEEPEATADLLMAIAEWTIEYYKIIKKYYPVRVINQHDDFGMGDRMIMSLNMWREIVKPYLKRLVDAAHELGFIYQHHSCGYMEPLIPEYIDLGIDAMDVVQRCCNKNIFELKKKYGDKITFVSAFDNVNVFDRIGATDTEFKNEYETVINAMAPGGSYISFPAGLTTQSMIPCMAKHFDICYRTYGS